jgi:hypothetical protein
MTNLFDALEFCLQEMERGVKMESVLARFPEHAEELRPILKAAAKAQQMSVTTPDAEVVRRSRARVMQHAAELREAGVASRRPRNVIPLFQRLVISFGLAAFFLLSGSGLLSASASALPGEQLYPVKRGWENIRLFFIFDSEARELLKDEFENERLHEVNELLAEGRDEVIEFAGVFMQVNGISYISGLQVILPPGMSLPANGDAVIVSGLTNAQGFVEIISLKILPVGSVVPAGNPVEMEVELEDETPETGAGEATEPVQYELSGILQSISATTLVLNGMTIYLDQYILGEDYCVGMEIEVKGYYAADGRFIVQEVKAKGECLNSGASSSSNSNSNSNENSNNDNNSNSDDNSNDDNSNDDDSNDNNSNDDNDDSGGDDDSGGGGDDDDNSGGGGDDDDDNSGGGGDDNDDNSGGGGDDNDD